MIIYILVGIVIVLIFINKKVEVEDIKEKK